MELGNNKTIEEWFENINENQKNIFPYDFQYVTRYKNYRNILNTWIHPYVEKGAMTFDGGCLNDHGPTHISKVIYNATQLIKSPKCELSEYEVYILLMAIHLHDVGNIYGREKHELNSIEVMQKIGSEAGNDRIEWDFIFDIAEAHGGFPKDKITALTTEQLLNFPIRRGFLAAILKFADELSDDRTRANRFQQQNNLLPLGSELYHMYSYCLHSVSVDLGAKQVKVLFDIEEKALLADYTKIKKNASGRKTKKKAQLLTEIYERTYKMHTERMYCMRFLRPDIEIDKIRVSITITLDKQSENKKRVKKYINYDLGEIGYPDGSGLEGVLSMIPKLKEYTAEKVAEKIKNNNLQDVTATY